MLVKKNITSPNKWEVKLKSLMQQGYLTSLHWLLQARMLVCLKKDPKTQFRCTFTFLLCMALLNWTQIFTEIGLLLNLIGSLSTTPGNKLEQ